MNCDRLQYNLSCTGQSYEFLLLEGEPTNYNMNRKGYL